MTWTDSLAGLVGFYRPPQLDSIENNLAGSTLQTQKNLQDSSDFGNFYDQGTMNNIKNGFNMSLQNAQKNDQPQIADTMSSFLSRPIQQQFDQAMGKIRSKYSSNNLKFSTYRSIEEDMSRQTLNKSLLDANQSAYLNSFGIASQMIPTHLNAANAYASMNNIPFQNNSALLQMLLNQYQNVGRMGKEFNFNANNPELITQLMQGAGTAIKNIF